MFGVQGAGSATHSPTDLREWAVHGGLRGCQGRQNPEINVTQQKGFADVGSIGWTHRRRRDRSFQFGFRSLLDTSELLSGIPWGCDLTHSVNGIYY